MDDTDSAFDYLDVAHLRAPDDRPSDAPNLLDDDWPLDPSDLGRFEQFGFGDEFDQRDEVALQHEAGTGDSAELVERIAVRVVELLRESATGTEQAWDENKKISGSLDPTNEETNASPWYSKAQAFRAKRTRGSGRTSRRSEKP